MGEEDFSNSLVAFIKSFPEAGECSDNIEDLKFPKPLFLLFEYLSDLDFGGKNLTMGTGSTAWLAINKALKPLLEKLNQLVQEWTSVQVSTLKIAKDGDKKNIQNLITLILVYGVHCPKKSEVLKKIKSLPKPVQSDLAKILKEHSKLPSEQSTPTKAAAQEKSNPEPQPATPVANKASEQPAKPAQLPAKASAQTEQKTDSQVAAAKDDRIQTLTQENQSLESEIAKLKEQIENAKKQKEQESVNNNTMVQQIGSIKTQVFTIQSKNNALMQKIQKKRNAKDLIAKLEKDRNELKEKLQQAEVQKQDSNSTQKIIETLNTRLQNVRLDPRNDKIEKIREDAKKYKSIIKKLQQADEVLKNRIIGQQSLSSLQERIEFLKNLEKTNVERLKRAKLSLALTMKSLRCDAFQKEMRSII